MQGRIKASVGPGAVSNVGQLQTYNQLTGRLLVDTFWLRRAVMLPSPNIFSDTMNNECNKH